MQHLSTNLVLVAPNMKSPKGEIIEVQRSVGVQQDGVYGPITANAVKNWKYRFGFHMKFVNTTLTVAESYWMFWTKLRTEPMKIRARARAIQNPVMKTVGQRAMEEMVRWANGHYFETRQNFVPQLSAEAKALGLGPGYQAMGWSWCAFATGVSGLKVGSNTYKQLFSGTFNQHLPLYVPAIFNNAQAGKYGLHLIGRDQAQPGDLVIFNWDGGVPDHIGRLVAKKDASTVLTVEGNTSAGATGSQNNGDGVYMRVRYSNTIVGYVREDS